MREFTAFEHHDESSSFVLFHEAKVITQYVKRAASKATVSERLMCGEGACEVQYRTRRRKREKEKSCAGMWTAILNWKEKQEEGKRGGRKRRGGDSQYYAAR